MQVSHTADHVTHAVIGGAQTIEFGISNDAAFFQILSSTLYSDQKLAVAREVLCNAWDIHILAGKTDVPVEVTISSKEVIVRDFGLGIAPDMMGPLYGTYGGTNKTNDGTQTGGFGLGCKSPFAYTDHFEVTSWFAGTKTIYNLSRSAADKMGKPGITPIVSLPCGEETGIQVRIPLKSLSDKEAFAALFIRVAANGEMLVNVNGEPVPCVPISKSDYNWLITSYQPATNYNHKIFVRYGNVIYPIENHREYHAEYETVTNFLSRLTSGYGRQTYSIIFQAEPNTISVTPSRESLSMQDHTIGTLKKLLEGFPKDELERGISIETEALLLRQIEQAKTDRNIGALMSAAKVIPGLHMDPYSSEKNDVKFIGSLSALAEQYVRKRYPPHEGFFKKDIGLRADAVLELGVGQRGHLQRIKKETQRKEKRWHRPGVTKKPGWKARQSSHPWFQRAVVRPLHRDVHAHPVIEWDRLKICVGKHYRLDTDLIEPEKYREPSFADYLPVLRRVIVLSYSKRGLWDRLKENEVIKAYGPPAGVWVYHAPVAKTKIQAVRDFFTKRGFALVDFTSQVELEKNKKPLPAVPAAPRVKRPKLPGYPALKGVNAPMRPIRVDNCFLPGQPRVEEPKLFSLVTLSRAETRSFNFTFFDEHHSRMLVDLFGDTCAVVKTQPQANKLRGQGLMELEHYAIDYVSKAVSTSPAFLEYWKEDLCKALGNQAGDKPRDDMQAAMVSLLDIKEVREALGLKTHLNAHDRMVLSLWRSMLNQWYWFERSKDDEGQATAVEARKAIIKMTLSEDILKVAENVKKNTCVQVFNYRQINQLALSAHILPQGELESLAKIAKIVLVG